MKHGRMLRTWAGALLALMVLGGAPAALGESVTVTSTVTGGTRTMTLKSLSGDALTGITLGTAGSGGFLTNVTDAQYERAGYQVTANLSDLYAYDEGSFDCGTAIPSNAFSLDYVADPLSLTDVAALPEPTWDLSGTLDATTASLLGISTDTLIEALDVTGERIDRTLDGIFEGAEDNLPIKVSTGTTGAFTDPGPHPTCDGGAATPTTRSLLEGDVSNLGDLFTWVTDEVTSAADANDDTTITAEELVSTGEVTDERMAERVRQALADAGVDLGLLDTLLADGSLTMDDIYDDLVATLDAIGDLIGQTGTYNSLPKLVASVPDETPAGTYRGTLTVTLVDLP